MIPEKLKNSLIKRGIREKLITYLEGTVLARYVQNNYGGHGIDHVMEVVSRSFEIIDEFNLKVNEELALTAACYHDIGYADDPDNHETVSAEMFKNDAFLSDYFSKEEIEEGARSIVDHRASLEYDARDMIGKIISSADRETDVNRMLTRSILYQTERVGAKIENPTSLDIIEASYKKLSSKYGNGGYAKMYYPDKKYQDYLKEMQSLLENKDAFIARELELIKTLDSEVKRILKK